MSAPLTKHITVGPARSGTTVTHLCVAGHSGVSAITDEVKDPPFFTGGLSTFNHGNDPATEKQTGFVALVDTPCTLNAPENLKGCGLKIAISNQQESATFVTLAQNYFPQTKITLTLRDDIVAQFGSLQHASLTGKWHSWVKQERDLEGQINLKGDRLRAHAINYLKVVKGLKSLHTTHQVFEISYQKEILPGNLEVYHWLFEFLGLQDAEINWLRSEKVAPLPDEFIAEYDRHIAAGQQLKQEFKANPCAFADDHKIEDTKSGFFSESTAQRH